MSTPAPALSLTGLPLRLVGNGVFFEDEVQNLLKSVAGKNKSFFTKNLFYLSVIKKRKSLL